MPEGVRWWPRAAVPACDRGWHYGDGLFETLAVCQGRPRLWEWHWERLALGCDRLGLPLPDRPRLERRLEALCHGQARAVLKLVWTAGCGGRGYGRGRDLVPRLRLALHPWPERLERASGQGLRVCLCRHRLPLHPPLAGIKHLNRLDQVLARREWDDPDIDEGLLADHEDQLVEATAANLFVVRAGGLLTPRLDRAGVAGVMRRLVLERLAPALGIQAAEVRLPLADLASAEGLFLTSSLLGIRPVAGIRELPAWSPGQNALSVISRLQDLLHEVLEDA